MSTNEEAVGASKQADGALSLSALMRKMRNTRQIQTDALRKAKHMLERDYIDDAKMAVINACEAAIALGTEPVIDPSELDDLDLRGLPAEITLYGKRLKAIGRGKFPYECPAKDRHPDAMIYFSPDAGWTYEHNRDAKAAIQREAVEGGDDANRS